MTAGQSTATGESCPEYQTLTRLTIVVLLIAMLAASRDVTASGADRQHRQVR